MSQSRGIPSNWGSYCFDLHVGLASIPDHVLLITEFATPDAPVRSYILTIASHRHDSEAVD